MSINSKMTALADEIRTLSGIIGKLGLDSMVSNLGDANNEIDTQADLIAQILIALEEKIVLAPGLYETGTRNMLKSWETLISEGILDSNGKIISGQETKLAGDLIVSNTVTSIGYEAFYGCTGLTNVTIPDSVTSIGNSAFSYCSGLTSIVIPNSVTYIGDSVFRGCSSLTSIVIPDGVTSIGNCGNCAHSSIIEIADHNMCLEGNCTCCTGFCYSWAPETEVSAYLRKYHHYDDGIAYRLEKLFGSGFAATKDTELILEGLDFIKRMEKSKHEK